MKFIQKMKMTFTGAGVRVFNAPVYQQNEPVRNPPNHNRYRGIKAGPRQKLNKRRCYRCSRYGHLARDCLAPRKPNRVSHPPSPPAADDKMEVEEQVVVVEEPSSRDDANVEEITGMVANVGVTNDDSHHSDHGHTRDSE